MNSLWSQRGFLHGPLQWRFRMWLADLLLNAGAAVQPEYSSQSRYSDDGQVIHLWREPA